MKQDDTLTALYEKAVSLPFGSQEYKKCLEEIGRLEYRNTFGKPSSGEKKPREVRMTVKFLKGTY